VPQHGCHRHDGKWYDVTGQLLQGRRLVEGQRITFGVTSSNPPSVGAADTTAVSDPACVEWAVQLSSKLLSAYCGGSTRCPASSRSLGRLRVVLARRHRPRRLRRPFSLAEAASAKKELCSSYQVAARSVNADTHFADRALARISLVTRQECSTRRRRMRHSMPVIATLPGAGLRLSPFERYKQRYRRYVAALQQTLDDAKRAGDAHGSDLSIGDPSGAP